MNGTQSDSCLSLYTAPPTSPALPRLSPTRVTQSLPHAPLVSDTIPMATTVALDGGIIAVLATNHPTGHGEGARQ